MMRESMRSGVQLYARNAVNIRIPARIIGRRFARIASTVTMRRVVSELRLPQAALPRHSTWLRSASVSAKGSRLYNAGSGCGRCDGRPRIFTFSLQSNSAGGCSSDHASDRAAYRTILRTSATQQHDRVGESRQALHCVIYGAIDGIAVEAFSHCIRVCDESAECCRFENRLTRRWLGDARDRRLVSCVWSLGANSDGLLASYAPAPELPLSTNSTFVELQRDSLIAMDVPTFDTISHGLAE